MSLVSPSYGEDGCLVAGVPSLLALGLFVSLFFRSFSLTNGERYEKNTYPDDIGPGLPGTSQLRHRRNRIIPVICCSSDYNLNDSPLAGKPEQLCHGAY